MTVYRHPHGIVPVGPGIEAPTEQVGELSAEWRWTLVTGDRLRRTVAMNRACGLADNASPRDRDRAIEARWPVGSNMVDAMAAAFQLAYQQMEANRPPAPDRDDPTDAWLRGARDSYQHHSPEWWTLDRLLDDYRDHVHTGVPLDHAVIGPHPEEG
jgi:hypothetical protein